MGILETALVAGGAYYLCKNPDVLKSLLGKAEEALGPEPPPPPPTSPPLLTTSAFSGPVAPARLYGVSGMGEASGAELARLTDLQNRIVEVTSGVEGIGQQQWEAHKDAFVQVVLDTRPGFGYTTFEGLKRDLQRAMNWVLLTPKHEPATEEINSAAMVVSSAERQLDLMRRLVPSEVAQRSVQDERATAERMARLPTLKDPSVVGRQAFVSELRRRTKQMMPNLPDPGEVFGWAKWVVPLGLGVAALVYLGPMLPKGGRR